MLPVPEAPIVLVVLTLVGKENLELPVPEVANILAPVVRVLAHIAVVDGHIATVDFGVVGSNRSRVNSFLK